MSQTSSSTTDPTPRMYRSELRARQAQETRQRIIEAAVLRFAESGYQATTLSSIAREAGVSTETVKTAASKAELLLAAFEVTFSGSESAESLKDTEVGAGVLELPDEALLPTVLTQIAGANARGFALWTVVLGAALSDEVVNAALQDILKRRRADYVMLIRELVRRGRTNVVDVESAADALSFLLSPESYQQLVDQAGWTTDAYTDWLRDAVDAQLRG
ncbi:TetR/AcrR family transcriptional regulator [Microbacterium sp.]|uniref:TetR/AcrR family transcriptional regulator n=1 Tax=Microbacterium sp. TaxID=51671 RepID=UPI0037CCA700